MLDSPIDAHADEDAKYADVLLFCFFQRGKLYTIPTAHPEGFGFLNPRHYPEIGLVELENQVDADLTMRIVILS